MPMSKKDYKAIAQIISDTTDATNIPVHTVTDALVSRLAIYFEKDNPNFDKHRFILACYSLLEARCGSI